jgi:hypothetical protein
MHPRTIGSNILPVTEDGIDGGLNDAIARAIAKEMRDPNPDAKC